MAKMFQNSCKFKLYIIMILVISMIWTGFDPIHTNTSYITPTWGCFYQFYWTCQLSILILNKSEWCYPSDALQALHSSSENVLLAHSSTKKSGPFGIWQLRNGNVVILRPYLYLVGFSPCQQSYRHLLCYFISHNSSEK